MADTHDLDVLMTGPDYEPGTIILGAVACVKILTPEGDAIWRHEVSPDLNSMEAIGMAISLGDDLRDSMRSVDE